MRTGSERSARACGGEEHSVMPSFGSIINSRQLDLAAQDGINSVSQQSSRQCQLD